MLPAPDQRLQSAAGKQDVPRIDKYFQANRKLVRPQQHGSCLPQLLRLVSWLLF